LLGLAKMLDPTYNTRVMLESLASGLAAISLAQLALIAAMAFLASLIGGVAGYGTGALMPLVLVPIVGPEPVVPILSLSALFTNSSRAAAFRHLVDWRRTIIVLAAAVVTCALGAWGYTLLTGKGALIVIGGMLIATVPLRRLMKRRGLALSDRSLAAAAFGWGPLAGGTVGAGIILLSLLMAAGLEGAAVVATDAAISLGIGLTKLVVFGLAGAVDATVVAVALLIGAVAFPGGILRASAGGAAAAASAHRDPRRGGGRWRRGDAVQRVHAVTSSITATSPPAAATRESNRRCHRCAARRWCRGRRAG